MTRHALLALAAVASFAITPVLAGQIVQRPGERPRELPNKCSQHPNDLYYGIFQGIGQKGAFLDKPIYEGGCFPTKKRCTAWLYAIRSDHGAGEQLANCKPR